MEKQQKKGSKKVWSVIGNVLIWIFVAFSVLMTILAFSAQSDKYGARAIGGKVILNVLTDSMKPTLLKGDIVIGNKLSEEEKTQLKVGDIITFVTDIEELGQAGQHQLISHRIVKVEGEGNAVVYTAEGDYNPSNQSQTVYPDDIACIVNENTRIAHLGAILGWMQSPNGFLVTIVFPLVLFFGLEIFLFVKKVKEVRSEGKKEITAADEELIKQRAIEEYLKQQAEANAAKEDTAAEEKPAEKDQGGND